MVEVPLSCYYSTGRGGEEEGVSLVVREGREGGREGGKRNERR